MRECSSRHGQVITITAAAAAVGGRTSVRLRRNVCRRLLRSLPRLLLILRGRHNAVAARTRSSCRASPGRAQRGKQLLLLLLLLLLRSCVRGLAQLQLLPDD